MYIQKRNTLTAGLVIDNVLAGDQYEFAPIRAIVEFGVVGSVTGLVMDILVGSRSVVTRMPVTLQRAANQFAVYPDEWPVRAGVQQSERVIVRITNPTGGSIDSFVSVKYNPR